MQDDPPRDDVDRALDAWTALPPPPDFADRVLAARDATSPPHAHRHPHRHSRLRRARRVGVLALAGAAAAAVAVIALRAPHRAEHGELTAEQRTTAALGDRGLVVAEPHSHLAWQITGGTADVTQRTGNVFYRVERGGAFVVHTPAGDVRVTGTCFRIEVIPMHPNHKLALAGIAGAAIASTVLVTVYEGHVIAETRSARTELAAGGQATLRTDDPTITAGATLTTATDDAHASREQLIARAHQQQAQLLTLRARVAQLEKASERNPEELKDVPEPGRLWHDPSPEKLAEWVASCHVRADQPSLDRFTPLTGPSKDLGIEADEVAGYNAALTEMQKRWKDLVRSLYLETTGDATGADSLSTESMSREIEDKNPGEEHNLVLQKISQERAGLAAPPTDLAKTSTLERLLRAYAALGDQSEAALAKRVGAERAHAIRGDGWSSRWELGGCPSSDR